MRKLILKIEYDDDAGCPMTEWDGQWTLHSFLRNSIHSEKPASYFVREWLDRRQGPVPVNIGLRQKLKVGLAFWLQYFEHGAGRYDLMGCGPQCQWDTTPLAGILVWEHSPKDMGAKTYEERTKDAEAFLETYNNWMNGDVYGYILTRPDGKHVDSCWGFYEEKYMLQDALNPGDLVQLRGEIAKGMDRSLLPAGVTVVDRFDSEDYLEEVFTQADGSGI